jgi:hypothetical protein
MMCKESEQLKILLKRHNNNLKNIVKIFQIEMYLEYNNIEYNANIFGGSGIGKFMELSALEYNKGYVSSGSGGMGFDLINRKTNKIVEVKSCYTIQNSTCNKCKTKFNPLFNKSCPNCKSTNFKIADDSRFGINAEEFLREFERNIFDNFTIAYLYLKNFKDNIVNLGLEWFKIKFDNIKIRDTQLLYFKNQADFGRKAHCNLLPNSYDFYKLCPLKIANIDIIFQIDNIEIEPIIKKQKCNYIPRIPINIFKKDVIEQFKKLKSFDNESADSIDFTLNIDYRRKSFGKERGNTRINLDKIIKGNR